MSFFGAPLSMVPVYTMVPTSSSFHCEPSAQSHSFFNAHTTIDDCQQEPLDLSMSSTSMVPPINKPPSFACALCSKPFASKSSLRQHVFVHIPEKQFLCEACGHSFKHRSSFCRHKRNSRACCLSVKSGSGAQASTTSPSIKVSGALKIGSMECSSNFQPAISLTSQQSKPQVTSSQAVDNVGPSSVPSSRLPTLSQGKRKEQSNQLECHQCKLEFVNSESLREHNNILHRSFRCLCNKAYFRKSHLKRHIYKHHPHINKSEAELLARFKLEWP